MFPAQLRQRCHLTRRWLREKESSETQCLQPQHQNGCAAQRRSAPHSAATISPPTNFLIKHPTVIHHDEHEFIFEGFSLFVSEPLKEIPPCKVVRFNIEYSILYFEEKMPDNFTLRELQLFHK